MNYHTYKQKLYQQLELLLDYLPYCSQSQEQSLVSEITFIRLKIKQIADYPDVKQEAKLFTATIESRLNSPDFKS